jgi:hypothetical protein
MTAPIDKAAEAVDALWLEGPLGTGPTGADEARAVFASIDTDELARALAKAEAEYEANDTLHGVWPGFLAEAVKAHLLKEDS